MSGSVWRVPARPILPEPRTRHWLEPALADQTGAGHRYVKLLRVGAGFKAFIFPNSFGLGPFLRRYRGNIPHFYGSADHLRVSDRHGPATPPSGGRGSPPGKNPGRRPGIAPGRTPRRRSNGRGPVSARRASARRREALNRCQAVRGRWSDPNVTLGRVRVPPRRSGSGPEWSGNQSGPSAEQEDSKP